MPRSTIATLCIAVFTVAASAAAAAQDYAREKRWADEILPAVVVGDPVYLQQTRGKNASHRFLGLFADAPARRPRSCSRMAWACTPITVSSVPCASSSMTRASRPSPSRCRSPDPKQRSRTTTPVVFDEAAHRIDVAARWLQAKGYRQIVLLSHSMGAWMANEYLINVDAPPYAAWICIGVTGRIVSPSSVKVPTLDLYGENDLEPTRRAAPLRRMMKMVMASGSEQVEVPGADHYFAGRRTSRRWRS
jgi:hypothetical protein